MVLPRLTSRQKRFIKVHARTGDAHYAAWEAGYADPLQTGNMMAKNPMIMDLSRAETQRYLFEKAGALSVHKLVEVLEKPDTPVGAIIKAASELAKLANIAISDADAEKPPDELSPGELSREVEKFRREFERQQKIAKAALARLPTAILEHENDVFD